MLGRDDFLPREESRRGITKLQIAILCPILNLSSRKNHGQQAFFGYIYIVLLPVVIDGEKKFAFLSIISCCNSRTDEILFPRKQGFLINP